MGMLDVDRVANILQFERYAYIKIPTMYSCHLQIAAT